MRELGVPYEVVPDPDTTRARILIESAKLFARHGYGTVSIRDLAGAIGVRPATLYFHYPGKEEILRAIIDRCEMELYSFYKLLDQTSARAESFEQVLRNIFLEPQATAQPFFYHAVWCAMHTQFLFEFSRHLYYDVFFYDGHIAMRRQLESAIERELVAPFDVVEIATLMTNSFLGLSAFHIAHLNGLYQDFDIAEWYERQIQHILRVTQPL